MTTGQTATPSTLPPRIRRRAKGGGRTLTMVAAVAAVAGLGWWGWIKTHPPDDLTSKLITDKVRRGDLTESVSASGSVTAQTGAQVKIGSQITGRIKRLYADVGSQVKEGQKIADLDLPDIQAQLDQATANYNAARTRYAQQQSGVGMQDTLTSSSIAEARANVNSAISRLQSAQASSKQQNVQTPNDIRRAQSSLAASKAALQTAVSNQKQVNAGSKLQIATAQEQVTQAKATAANALINFTRQKKLLADGFVSQSVVDSAEAANSVAQSQVQSATENVSLLRTKVAADIQTAADNLTQAQQNVDAAQAALESAQAGKYTNSAKQADVENAASQVKQTRAALQIALGNTAQTTIKRQDVQAAKEQMAASKSQIDFYKAQFDKTTIRSPISGTVLQLAAQQGETLAAGLSAPTLIIVADLKRLQVDVFVDETDIAKVKLGQQTEVTVDAFAKTRIKGHITKVASGSTIQQGVITYDVTIKLDDARAIGAGDKKTGVKPGVGGKPRKDILTQLRPDMSASVNIVTGTRSNVLLVPAEAVKVGVRGAIVNVVTKVNGKSEIKPQKVKTGASDGTSTEIQDGVKEGDVIVLAGMESGSKGGGPSSPFGPSGGAKGGGKGKGKGG